MNIAKQYPRSIIFFSALLVRVVVGYLFYGSIDVSAFIGINTHTFNDTLKLHPFSIWCSFPVIPFYLWFCGFLSIKTSLPIAFCFKVIPIFFDSILALLLYDIMRRIAPKNALKVGLLYAFSPVALIVTCIHGQWESLPIFFFLLALYIREFFTDSYVAYFCYGLLFAFSFLLKPLSLVFLLFFFVPFAGIKKQLGQWWCVIQGILGILIITVLTLFIFFKVMPNLSLVSLITPVTMSVAALGAVVFALVLMYTNPWRLFSAHFKKYIRYQAMGVAGLMSMVIFCFMCFAFYGLNVFSIIEKVLRYFNQGIQMFGLPFAYPLNQGVLGVFLKNRFWIMGLIALVAYMYYTKRKSIFNAIVTSIMIIFSFSGLSPQYLLWAIPFLLITESYVSVALFNIAVSVFCVLYYMNPLANPEVPYQSMSSFAAIKPFGWIMPPDFFISQNWIHVIKGIGNYLIPVCCMIIAFVLFKNMLQESYGVHVHSRVLFCAYKNMYLVVSFACTAIIALLMVFVNNINFAAMYSVVVAKRFDVYDVHMVGQYAVGNYGSINWFNIAFMLIGLSMVWSFVAWRTERHSDGYVK
jgi:hypothetical protein